MFDPSPLPATLVDRLSSVRSCGVITGAGVSKESGVGIYPTEGPLLGTALSAKTLARDPDHTWEVAAELCRQADRARPSASHRTLVAIEDRMDRFVLLTQNVDGLHQLAGSRNVVELHGNIFRTRCLSCGATGPLDRTILPGLDRAPLCPRCDGVLRPDVVLMGEVMPLRRVEPLLEEFYLHPPDLVVVVGTSARFPYISEPVLFAAQASRMTVEINPEQTVLTDQVSISLRGTAATYLPAIARALGVDADRLREPQPRPKRKRPRDLEAG